MKFIKRLFIGIFFLLLTTASLNYSGLCIKNLSWHNDDEITKIAINRTLGRQIRKRLELDGTVTVDRPILYKSINDFKLANPNCCEVSKYRDTPEGRIHPPFIDRITGFFTAFVTVKYKKRYQENQGIISKEAYEIYRVKNCGS